MITLTRTGQVCLHHNSDQIHFIAGNIRLISLARSGLIERGGIEKPSVYKTYKRYISEFTGIHIRNPENRCKNGPVSWDLVLSHSFLYNHNCQQYQKLLGHGQYLFCFIIIYEPENIPSIHARNRENDTKHPPIQMRLIDES